MADRYTLPSNMGGHECEIEWRKGTDGEGNEVSRVRYRVHDKPIESVVPSSWLTPVKPPLPPEPPDRSVVRISKRGLVLVRYGSSWYGTAEFNVGAPERRIVSVWTWQEICATALPDAPILLVEAPFAEPVQLPWRGLAKGIVSPDVLNVRPVEGGGVMLAIARIGDEDNERWIWLDDETGKTVARAVWAAANQADKGDHE